MDTGEVMTVEQKEELAQAMVDKIVSDGEVMVPTNRLTLTKLLERNAKRKLEVKEARKAKSLLPTTQKRLAKQAKRDRKNLVVARKLERHTRKYNRLKREHRF